MCQGGYHRQNHPRHLANHKLDRGAKIRCRLWHPLPAQYAKAFETAEDQQAVSIELCTKLCETLIQGGVEDLHFYTLNRPTLTKAVCANLGVNA